MKRVRLTIDHYIALAKRVTALEQSLQAALDRIDVLAGHQGQAAERMARVEKRLSIPTAVLEGRVPLRTDRSLDHVPVLEEVVAEREGTRPRRAEEPEGTVIDNMVAAKRVEEFKKKREVGYSTDERLRWDNIRFA